MNFVKKNNIIGVGWPLDEDTKKGLDKKDFLKYRELVEKKYSNNIGIKKVLNCYAEFKENTLIWTRDRVENIYYICKIVGDWEYGDTEENRANDILSYFNVEFVEVGTIEKVPGKVINSFRATSTLQRIDSEEILELTKKIYNQKTKSNFFETNKIPNNNFFDFLLPEDVEEIISLYLQIEKKYLIYSSTNKVDTGKYEFVMTSRDGKEKCYLQVKTGNEKLTPENYIKLTENNNKVFLFALGGYNGKNVENIICLDKSEIILFINKNFEILPTRIQYWINESKIKNET